MAESLAERLRRLLVMVPYVLEKNGATVEELCRRFGITPRQLAADVDLLFVCGRPGYTPGDLIEAEIDGDRVVIRQAPYFARPPYLTAQEGLILYAGARAAGAAGVAAPALQSAMAKLEKAFGEGVLDRVEIDVESLSALAQIREARARRRRIHLVYYAHSRDETTRREVDPWGLFFTRGHWYLAGWCHSVGDERVFRVDRMREVEVLDAAAEVPEGLDLGERAGTVYVEGPDAIRVVLELAPEAARWVEEYYPLLERSEAGDGWVRVVLSSGATAWVEMLLLRLGGQARVVEPEALGARVRERACRLAERYAR